MCAVALAKIQIIQPRYGAPSAFGRSPAEREQISAVGARHRVEDHRAEPGEDSRVGADAESASVRIADRVNAGLLRSWRNPETEILQERAHMVLKACT